jgi:Tol biopolymer transport system component
MAAAVGVLLLSWVMRTLLLGLQPAAGVTSTPDASFEARLRTGEVCGEPLAVAYGLAVFLTNEDKTRLVRLDQEQTIGELRSIAWSPDGRQLALIGNTTGRGMIQILEPAGGQLQYLLSSSDVGYLMDATWSRDGKQFVIWSSQNNRIVYLLNANGTGLMEKRLELQILGTPQFAPDSNRLVFYGADSNSSGLFEVTLNNFQTRLLSAQVEDEGGYAFSPDGSRLAYMEMDRNTGDAHLLAEEMSTGRKTVLGTLPIPKGSGSSLPEAANLSWSADGKSLLFDFGRNAVDRAIYIAHADGSGLIKLVESAYAPAISTDGQCLAYISDKQVFLMELTGTSSSSTPLLLADLPVGKGIPNFKLDKLQWRP